MLSLVHTMIWCESQCTKTALTMTFKECTQNLLTFNPTDVFFFFFFLNQKFGENIKDFTKMINRIWRKNNFEVMTLASHLTELTS